MLYTKAQLIRKWKCHVTTCGLAEMSHDILYSKISCYFSNQSSTVNIPWNKWQHMLDVLNKDDSWCFLLFSYVSLWENKAKVNVISLYSSWKRLGSTENLSVYQTDEGNWIECIEVSLPANCFPNSSMHQSPGHSNPSARCLRKSYPQHLCSQQLNTYESLVLQPALQHMTASVTSAWHQYFCLVIINVWQHISWQYFT